jgi:RNA polymerase sigma-70 factor (ECF subfamily)
VEFESWYRRVHPRLVSWLTVAAGDVELARDAASEACTRAYARWAHVERMTSPEGWLFAVAYNVMRRHRRRAAFELRLLRRVDPEPMVVPAPLSDDVWDAVRSLPLRQRTAIALRYVSDLTQEEIAAVMDVAPGTVSATLVAARRRLGELLDDPSVTTGEDGP